MEASWTHFFSFQNVRKIRLDNQNINKAVFTTHTLNRGQQNCGIYWTMWSKKNHKVYQSIVKSRYHITPDVSFALIVTCLVNLKVQGVTGNSEQSCDTTFLRAVAPSNKSEWEGSHSDLFFSCPSLQPAYFNIWLTVENSNFPFEIFKMSSKFRSSDR